MGVLALASAASVSAWSQQPIVVELFTSEGCSSCPPAEAMLMKLSQQRDTQIARLVLLEEHVTYWNTPSFVDRFSDPAYTDRQSGYVKDFHLETAYTPQIVIDGKLQTSGNRPATVQEMILQQAKVAKPATVTLQLDSTDKVRVTVEGPAEAKAQVLLAVTEDDLSTEVKGGENKGRVLKHDAVVRSLEPVGSLSQGRFDKIVKVPAKPEWKKPQLRALVLVQDKSSGAILGAAEIPLNSTPTTTTAR
jgi:hypothetical protein